MVVEEAGEGEAHLAHLGGSSLSIDHSSPGSLRYSFGPLQPSSPPEVDPYFGTFLDRADGQSLPHPQATRGFRMES